MQDDLYPDDCFMFTADQRRLCGQWIGKRDGRPLLIFLHEGLGSIPQWKQFPEVLCTACNLPGLVYERYGFGRSDALTEKRDVGYLEHEGNVVLPEVIQALSIDEPYILVGHSDGGSIALVYAAKKPSGLLGVITEAAHVFVEEITLEGIREARQFWNASSVLKSKLERYHWDHTETTFLGWNDTWQLPAFRDWNITSYLKDITCPLLVMQGIADQYGSEAQVEAIVAESSGPAIPCMVPEAGHSPHLEQREVVLSTMKNWILKLIA